MKEAAANTQHHPAMALHQGAEGGLVSVQGEPFE
jgi:hypothetical protein